MKIAIGSDHAGFGLKEILKAYLKKKGHRVIDMGTESDQSVDYPDYCFPVAVAVARGRADRGIVLGGSGNGEAMAANRVRGVRCALVWNAKTAELCRLHNDANVISFGARLTPPAQARRFVDIWLKTEFEGGRHVRRIRKLDRKPNAQPPRT
jgi:ribose 5-phosphate isomerase B